MKLKKGLDHGLNGFHVATIPKAPRSTRRRAQHRKTDEDSEICAIELLASLARKLLQESESSASSNASRNDHAAISKETVKDGCLFEDKPLKTECLERGSCEGSAVMSQSASQNCDQKCSLNEIPLAEDDDISERTSKFIDSGFSGKVGGDAIYKNTVENVSLPSKVEGGSPNFGESFYNGLENVLEQQLETNGVEKGGLNGAEACSSRDPTELCMTFPSLINSDRDVKLPSCRNPVPNSLYQTLRNANKLGVRDDDDNLSRTNKLSNKLKVYRPVTRIGDRRMKKLLTSKYWKVAPKLKDFEQSRADGRIRPLNRKRKPYSHERCQHDAFHKRRKFHDHNSVDAFEGGFSSESVTDSPEKGRNGDKRRISSISRGASGMTSFGDHQATLYSKDSNVKFSIKSFKVPEIFVEVSETATVSSLKRTIMDAVTAILGGGLRVGVLLHGKKIRDDNRTLSQTGISSEDSLDTLVFTLEPSPVQGPPPLCSAENPPLLLPCDTPQLAPRSSVTSALDLAIPNALPGPPPPTSEDSHVKSDCESLIPHTDLFTNTTLPDSRAIVAVPPIKVEALAVVPVNQKIRRTDIAQRRTRRPFSVSEVEALVQAVEELGTGRWRDVKLRSFEDSDHRTYVDLKDKWKTLVHTARISPQQRRGEPVPQELLDRVLAAHAYWSQNHVKQQGKHQPGIPKIYPQANEDGVPAV
ncbi:telomere repeat-binding protein 4-like [Mangifera indica]|uniref:telomere repeat-binding protein 4-like n=1 Tax=Mangifera indica TaxID=29780 RepID=UPI001CFA0945|nr:telomere repeat-binding protein 4-like [Mangifera indica]XP_044509791.1 telomere repeat-binding protein 4-like [Mangifera indica]